MSWYTVCTRSSDPYYRVTHYIKWMDHYTSWTAGTINF